MKYINISLIAITIIACGPSTDEQLQLIEKTEIELFDSSETFDMAKAEMLIRNYDQFATKNPKHDKAASFLFRAGDISTGMGKSDMAIAFFDRVCNDYPDFKKAPDALFLKAFVLENQLKDYDQAEQSYKLFIEKYPNHDMVSSAEFSIKNLGIPAEELIKAFEQKATENKMDSAKSDTSQVLP